MVLRFCHIHFVMIISVISLVCSASSNSENDRTALLALRDGFTLGGNPSDDSALHSWNSSLHICDWKGIICGRRHKRVTVINLVKQKLNGVLSPSIGNLSFLRELNLPNNSLHGEIPKQMGNLHRLRYLNLGGNSFQGKIPVEISNCSNLEILALGVNELTGQIPSQVGSLSKITVFYVGRNNLTGVMPNFWKNFSSLARLHIGNNNLHGEIKESLQGLSNLTILGLAANNFFGTIPQYMYNLSSLIKLDLSSNNFSGSLVQDIDAAFPRLEVLSLGFNSFTGFIPSTLSNVSELSIIQMTSNMFSGSVPDSLGNLKSLRRLRLSDNLLGGGYKSDDLRFINSLTNCTNLEFLEFSDNMFGGQMPNSLGNLSFNLEFLVMSGNYITGPIPEEIGKMYGLSTIDFGSNMISGTIPDSIGNLSNIFRLYLSNNNLHGQIPSSLGELKNLYVLDLSANLLDGNIPQALGSCKGLQQIDISRNHFGGYLQGEIFDQFENLIFCFLSHNSFDGILPLVFRKLRLLKKLDVSYNKFIGEIPTQLGESLEFLNMAGNSFQGSIPASLGSCRGLIALDLSNNNLTGRIPKEFTSLMFLQNLNLSFNQLNGEVPLFKNGIEISVEGNKMLCSWNQELQLPTCFHSRKRKTILLKVIIAAAISTFASLSFCALLSVIFFRRRRYKKENADDIAEKYRKITYVELFKATEGFAESNLIGKGSFGDVFKGYLDGDENTPVAVKVLNLSENGAAKSFSVECKVLQNIRHRNLLRIITSCSSLDHKGNDFKALVFEFMSNGNLDSWLHLNKDQEARAPLTLVERLQIALDIGCALNYLINCCEEPPIIHCDLKPSNILLDDDMVARVADFGMAKMLYGVTENISRGESLTTVIKGTIGYIAPEYGMGATISPLGDIYSYGILILELITGRRPTNEMFNNEMNLRSFIVRSLPDHLVEVVDECLLCELKEAMAMETNPDRYQLQWHSYLVSFAEVGISCSIESPKERMDIQSAMKCLMRIKEKALG